MNQDEITLLDGVNIDDLLMNVPDDCLNFFNIEDVMNGSALLPSGTDQDMYSVDSGADSLQVSTATSTHSVICFILCFILTSYINLFIHVLPL